MKFGETLWQRSVPKWQNYNIDYQTLKTYIRDYTSPTKTHDANIKKEKGNIVVAIPIPGSEPPVKEIPGLEDRLYTILKNEHDRVGLFVRSKQYEIGSRLGSIERQLNQLQRRNLLSASSSKRTLKLKSRISKIETDILSVGNEIQNLSRFVAINRLAIRKLVKKHKKWTASMIFGQTIQKQLLDQPDSFTNADLDESLDRYTRYLSAVREPFSGKPARSSVGPLDGSSPEPRENNSANWSDLASLFHTSDVDFDAAMTLPCDNSSEGKVVYWVHHDNIVELRILLLQHMRYANFNSTDGNRTTTASSTDYCTSDGQDGKATYAGAIIMAKSNSDLDPSEDEIQNQTSSPRLAAIARWTAAGNARVCMQLSKVDVDTTGVKTVVNLDRDRLMAILLLESSSRRAQFSRLSEDELYATSDDDNDNAIRGYMQRNADLKAVARIFHKRSRFVGLENSLDQGLWASIDEDVRFSSMSGNERRPSEVYKVPDDGGQDFPHAVLSLRAAGESPALIAVLNNSHLTERVENFSLEAHVFATYHENSQSTPWLPKLLTDIRHIPSAEPSPLSQTCSRKPSNIDQFNSSSSSKLQTPNLTSASGTSDSYGPVTPDPEGLVAFTSKAPYKKSNSPLSGETAKQRSRRLHQRQSQPELPVQQQTYWNEYDNPGSDMGGDGEGFVVFVDPNAPMFPGQFLLTRWCNTVKSLFHEKPERDVERQDENQNTTRTIDRKISRMPSMDSGETTSDEEDDDADADDEQNHAVLHSARRVPTLVRNKGLNITMDSRPQEYGTFTLPSPQTRLSKVTTSIETQSDTWLNASTLCFTAAILIETAMSLLLSTSRRSLKGEVDVAVLVGVGASLTFAAIGVGVCSTRRRRQRGNAALAAAPDPPDSVAKGAVVAVKSVAFVFVCVWAGVLLALALL